MCRLIINNDKYLLFCNSIQSHESRITLEILCDGKKSENNIYLK